ncbi:DNA repair protein RadC [Staphylococcus sp. SQ8-PEA]|uniref:DNA repair protein RadC n=1 Tax=Staphylococcus marylandisciuri TaxID=2981529 RepID=A0ABT2QQ06_9STAP|nr:DNA repair protein RadC [Staphylococcus marylandisciuri]MCU5746065.1 DNA repair protein RadC [Staphylococcus marylandisciuri]
MKINELAMTEKPRERLINDGAHQLSNTELLAILINTGRKGYSSLDIAAQLLKSCKNLKELKHLSILELTQVKGVGISKAVTLKAAVELGERIHSSKSERKFQISSPKDVAQYAMSTMQHLTQEHFIVLFLDAKNRVLHQKTIFIGTLTASIVHPREIFSEAIRWASHSIIVMHNHPSGDASPSEEDIRTTKRLISCGSILGIDVLDHVIIGEDNYISLREEELLDDE